MNTQTHKTPVLLIIAMLAMTALITSACSLSNVQVYTPSPVIVKVTLYEDQLNDLSMNDGVRLTEHYDVHFSDHYGVYLTRNDGIHLTDHCQPVLGHATRVELHDGYIRFVGTKDQLDGSEVEGSLDLSMTAENGQLNAKIFAVDIPGVDLNNHCVVESNEELEYAFTHMLDYTPGDVQFKEVVVEEGVLRMKIQVNLD
jgi:hypothetical protein